jgi:hypothetical protein
LAVGLLSPLLVGSFIDCWCISAYSPYVLLAFIAVDAGATCYHLAAASTYDTATNLRVVLTACINLFSGLQPYFVVDGTTLQFPQDKNTLEVPAMPSEDQWEVDGVSFKSMVFLPDAKLRYLLLCWICEPTASAARNTRPVLSATTWAEMYALASRPWNEDPRLGLQAVLGLPGDAESSQGGHSITPTISGAASAWLDYVLDQARKANPRANKYPVHGHMPNRLEAIFRYDCSESNWVWHCNCHVLYNGLAF